MPSNKELKSLLNKNSVLSWHGKLEKITKNIPENKNRGGLDPRVKEILSSQSSGHLKKIIDAENLMEIRNKKIRNRDLSPSISTEEREIKLEDRSIPIRIYNRQHSKRLPLIIYYHGGGFFSGDMNMVENPCKWLASEAEAVVISVEYRLAPEHPYQDGLNDCYEALHWAYEHADEILIDRENIGLIGDSVGGNLALGVNLLSKDKEWNIKHVGLIYPLLDLTDFAGDKWSLKQYNLSLDEAIIRHELTNIRQSIFFIQSVYLNDLAEAFTPLVSPLRSNHNHDFAAATIITAEYDYLKIQGQEFANQMADADVAVRHIEYKGMTHSFIENFGLYPQAEDSLSEIANHFKEVIH
ncbi:alpha/beta hydrolase [Alteribacillus sp. HJP-4]|uniref:alpha/beta hydrolase n=1 Tax=Alteribacillus sp. HJP-4 TaxID=2775394 RepID=UPI0035CCD640